jgi:hypothetical protein
VAIRLVGGLHALVRAGSAPGLAEFYPPNPAPNPGRLGEALSPILAGPELLPWLDSPPQTNEVGRSAVLMSGLLAIADRFDLPMELLELGASAGLNLNLDRYACLLGGRRAGDRDSAVRLEPDWRGEPPPASSAMVAARRGVDLNPLDPVRDGARLLAYVWPDQRERLDRLEAAIALATAHPPPVERGEASRWLESRLAEPQPAGLTRVVLHSVAFQYFPADAQRRIAEAVAAAGAAADDQRPLAWLRYEKVPQERQYSLRLRLWPGGGDERLAWAHPHGTWINWVRGR